jgi:hypothetical protein
MPLWLAPCCPSWCLWAALCSGSSSPELVVRILQGIGRQVTRAPSDQIGIHLTRRANGSVTADALT